MNLNITPEAAACFREEWGYREGDFIRLHVRYSSGSADAFSLGIMRDSPRSAALKTERQGMTFFIEQDDVWFLDGKNLTVDCGPGKEIVLKLSSS